MMENMIERITADLNYCEHKKKVLGQFLFHGYITYNCVIESHQCIVATESLLVVQFCLCGFTG